MPVARFVHLAGLATLVLASACGGGRVAAPPAGASSDCPAIDGSAPADRIALNVSAEVLTAIAAGRPERGRQQMEDDARIAFSPDIFRRMSDLLAPGGPTADARASERASEANDLNGVAEAMKGAAIELFDSTTSEATTPSGGSFGPGEFAWRLKGSRFSSGIVEVQGTGTIGVACQTGRVHRITLEARCLVDAKATATSLRAVSDYECPGELSKPKWNLIEVNRRP